MNANALQRGHDYAYSEYASRNKSYYPYAKRVRVLFVYKLDSDDLRRQKKVTLVECQRLNEDGTPTGQSIITVPARNIVSTWDEHLTEQARHEQERIERNARLEQQRQESLERERGYREKREKELEEARVQREEYKQTLANAFQKIGIPADRIQVNSYDISISLPKWMVEGVINNIQESVRTVPDQELTEERTSSSEPS